MGIKENVELVKEKAARASERAGRDPGEITIVAATKMNDASRVRQAIEAGIEVCGENRVQELLQKNSVGAYDGARLHFIGHLQKNKVKDVVGVCDIIESVDSEELISLIGKRAGLLGIRQEILIEINIGREKSKSGIMEEDINKIMDFAEKTSGVFISGLMAIPPISNEPEKNREYFERMYKLFIDMQAKKRDNINMRLLSMGMSADYEDAIAAGANIVRVGTAIFGQRHY